MSVWNEKQPIGQSPTSFESNNFFYFSAYELEERDPSTY